MFFWCLHRRAFAGLHLQSITAAPGESDADFHDQPAWFSNSLLPAFHSGKRHSLRK